MERVKIFMKIAALFLIAFANRPAIAQSYLTVCVPAEWSERHDLGVMTAGRLNALGAALYRTEKAANLSSNNSDDSNEQDDQAKIEDYTCKLSDALDGELSCQVGKINPEFSSGDIRGVLACFRDGSKKLTETNFFIKGWVGVKIAKLLTILDIEAGYNRKTQQKEFLYTCRITENGQVRKGSLEDIVEWYREYLKQKKDKENESGDE